LYFGRADSAIGTGAVVRPTAAREEALENFIRRGGSLLVALDPHAGVEAFRLAPILPSTIWRFGQSGLQRL
jgi:hypothetical protein